MQATTAKRPREQSIERALEKSEARFRQVVEASPSAMVMIRATGLIEMVNAQAELLFGYPRGEMLGLPVEMLTPERFRQHHPAQRSSFFADPTPRPMGAGRDLFGLRKDGGEFPVEIGLSPIETEEGVMVLSAIADISERVARESRVQATLREKELLLGEIHHRVKNNLQVIHSLLSLQAAKLEDASLKRILIESQNRVRSMALIHQSLYESHDFARVDFGAFLKALCAQSYLDLQRRPGADGAFHPCRRGVPADRRGDPCGLIVNELVANALEHGFPEGGLGEIKVSLTQAPDNDIILSVSDDGVGVSNDLDFDRADTLGLQLVRLLGQQLGAILTVRRSQPTQFQLRFPVTR